MCLVSVVQAALNACTQLGGSICAPAGTYTISMPNVHHQLATDICLAIPSDCTLFGEGAASILDSGQPGRLVANDRSIRSGGE